MKRVFGKRQHGRAVLPDIGKIDSVENVLVDRKKNARCALVGRIKAEVLSFLGKRLAEEVARTAEVKAHVGMLVAMLLHKPGEGIGQTHAKLLVELAHKRLMHRFAILKLAAGELPVSSPGLAFGAGGEKHSAIFANQHADGNIHNLVFTHDAFPLSF